jgi:hypothetical protein
MTPIVKDEKKRKRWKSGQFASVRTQAVILKIPIKTHRKIKEMAWDKETSAHDFMVQALIDHFDFMVD